MGNFGNYLESKKILSINFDTNNKSDITQSNRLNVGFSLILVDFFKKGLFLFIQHKTYTNFLCKLSLS